LNILIRCNTQIIILKNYANYAYELWDIIKSGYTHPTKISLDGEVYLKPISEYDDKEKKRYDYNVKAMIAFFYTLNHVEFTRVKNYKIVFEI